MAETPVSLCLVVPHYDHVEPLLASLPALLSAGRPVIVVDDGSDPSALAVLREQCDALAAGGAALQLIERVPNAGKGAAVLAGAAVARSEGHSHVLQIDADGQHDIDDLPALLARSQASPDAIVSGCPVFADDAPAARVHGRKLTTAMIAIETAGGGIEDGLCGYRIYPLAAIERIAARFSIAPRMGFDTDMLVKACWLQIPVHFVPTRVRYPADGRSHFHYVRDNLALIGLHTRLLLGAARRAPALLQRRRARRRTAQLERL